MPDFYGAGESLNGLAGLIQGLRHLFDPDKDKRDRLNQLIARDPRIFQQLVDQQNPDLIQNIIGNRPKFGGKDDYDSLLNAFRSAPLSQQANALTQSNIASNPQLQDQLLNNIGNAGVQDAYGFKTIPNDIGKIGDYLSNLFSGNVPNQTNKDVANVALGIGTTAQQNEQAANTETAKSRSELLKADANDKAREQAATAAVSAYMKGYKPTTLQKYPILDAYLNPNTDPNIKNQISTSSSHQDQLKTEIAMYNSELNRELERRSQDMSKENRDDWYPKLLTTNALQAWANFGFPAGDQGLKGFQDLYFGRQSPEAASAKEMMATGTPKQKAQMRNEYNTALKRAYDLIDKSGKRNSGVTPDDVQSAVDVVNMNAQRLIDIGEPVSRVKYDVEPNPGIGEILARQFPLHNPKKVLITEQGGVPQMINPLGNKNVKSDTNNVKNYDGPSYDELASAISLDKSLLDGTLADPKIPQDIRNKLKLRFSGKN